MQANKPAFHKIWNTNWHLICEMSISNKEMQIKQQLRYYVFVSINWDEKPMTKCSLGEDIGKWVISGTAKVVQTSTVNLEETL